MRLDCECGKVLHADECGFHNDNYKDVLIYVCPYCGAKTTAFVSLTPEKSGSVREIVPGLEFTPEKLEPSLEERFKQFVYKMTQRNEAVLGERPGPNWNAGRREGGKHGIR